MKNEFPTVYSAIIITRGDKAYVEMKDEAVFLEGVKIDPSEHIGPKEAGIKHLVEMDIAFPEDWLLYVCQTIHDNEDAPDGEFSDEQFIVSHYWVDVTNLRHFRMPEHWIEMPLEELANNTHENVFHADQLAAQRVIDIRGEKFNGR